MTVKREVEAVQTRNRVVRVKVGVGVRTRVRGLKLELEGLVSADIFSNMYLH